VSAEATRARAQFRVIEELPLPGKFYEVDDVRVLAGVLARALGRRMRYWVEGQDNVLASGVPSEGLMTSQVGGNARWFAPALAPWPLTDTPFALRWSNRPGYPAPAWTLDVPRWPSSPGTSSAARPSLRVWWNPDQVAPASGGLDRGADFDLDSGRPADPVPIE